MPDKMQELLLCLDCISKFHSAYDRKRFQDSMFPNRLQVLKRMSFLNAFMFNDFIFITNIVL